MATVKQDHHQHTPADAEMSSQDDRLPADPESRDDTSEEDEVIPAVEVVDQNGHAMEQNRSAVEDADGKESVPEDSRQQDYTTIPSEPITNNATESIPSHEANGDHALEMESSQPSGPPSIPDTPTISFPQTPRPRTDSQSTTATMATTATRFTVRSTRSSMVFVVAALESIAASKDARKKKPLADSTQRALSAIRTASGDASQLDPEILFEPLNLATEAVTVSVVTTALDCIGKLISYSYFSQPAQISSRGDPSAKQRPPLIERAIDTICESFQGEATPPEVEMQIIKSLLAAILNDKIVVHGAGLLKSIRQTYNIFLYSKNSANQQIAQGTCTQMIGTVFERVRTRLAAKTARANSSKSSLAEDAAETMSETSSALPGDETPAVPESETPTADDTQPKMTLQTFETRKSFDDARITDAAPTTVTRAKKGKKQPVRTASGTDVPTITVQSEGNEIVTEDEEEDEVYMKDAFLVFRAMCKLCTKSLRVEEAVDVKSQGMRSKLLSLHILHTVLFNHHEVFTSPHATIRSSSNGEASTFTQAVKQYLCLSLSRNGASSVLRVFEVASEIFWLMTKYLRPQLKRELEVFLKEIYLTILDKRAAPGWQKSYIVQHVFGRIAADPKALVEVYLNYDCDRQALDNMYQRIVEHVSRLASPPVQVNAAQQHAYVEHVAKQNSSLNDWRERGTLPPSLSTAGMSSVHETDLVYPPEYAQKMQALECLVDTLRSLVSWTQQGIVETAAMQDAEGRFSTEDVRESTGTRGELAPTNGIAGDGSSTQPQTPRSETPLPDDDPAELEKVKARKTALNNAIRAFNYKPKRGIKTLISDGFITSSEPKDIARFLINNERINKKSLGEFLGEGDDDNVKIMHAFVDQMDFVKSRFVDALRRFLQSFRLPGEAQKIDRLMLKFAERYLAGNPNAFANADTAYILGYSVIMLNTDQHSAQVKVRMTPEDFKKNNRGINDGGDLPEEYLQAIFDEIQRNEIVLDTERQNAANLGIISQQPAPGGLVNALANVGRDYQREAYAQASEEMSNRTEQLFKNLLRAQKKSPSAAGATKGRYLTASSFKHVGPMFDVTWMSFLTALSGAAQETQNLDVLRLCMEGQKLAIRIACLFDLADPRQAFVASLGKQTNLYNLSEMKVKNLEALYTLLDVAYGEGEFLKESWREVLTCVSQLDRFQLISSGVEEGAVPDVLRAQAVPQNTPTANGAAGRKSVQLPRRPAQRAGSFQADIAAESRSADMIRGVDRIFTNTAQLSGDAIVHFVRALTQVSWQEIQSSGASDSPRTYSLQKLVEISGYNMLRVRFEWTRIWTVLGQHFIDVGCHRNTHVVYFALNSLRQLSMRFMEIEELPGFKFQKDFLKPFELILRNAQLVAVKDMVLRCLIQMIQARGDMIRSGWKTMFGVFTVAAQEPDGAIVGLAFDNVTQVYNERFGVVIQQGAFADLVVCLTEFSKNAKFQRKSLQAIETLRGVVPRMLRTPECPLAQQAPKNGDGSVVGKKEGAAVRQTQEEQYWFPVLFAFHDVLMTGEDLEVRSQALNYLFDTLTKFGGDFPRHFWDTLWRQLLYPIFMVLKDRKAVNHEAVNHEELSVWLSTTLIQALRHLISLFTHFFDGLEYMLDRFLELLALCICQENDTLARIGSNCLQQLILQNVRKFGPAHWEKIVGAFVELFQRTEAGELFSAANSGGLERSKERTASMPNGNGEMKTPSAPGGDVALGEANALRIEGLPSDASSEVAILNGDGHLSTQPTEPSNSLALEDGSEPHRDRSVSPPPRKPSDLEDFASPPPHSRQQQQPIVVTAARRRYFNQIITKCVLQLLMIETVSELFNNDAVYASIPSHLLLKLMALLKKSFHFAKRFNEDRELRTRLFREGFMKQPPNLLKQESGSASVYVLILLRMYADDSDERRATRAETEEALIPLCADILAAYIALDEETQQRNIGTWRPVVVDVLEGVSGFGDEAFAEHVGVFAPLAVGLMGREMGAELQRAVQGVWGRVCEVQLSIGKERVQEMLGGGNANGNGTSTGSPVAGRAGSVSGGWGRRGSRAAR